MSNDTNLEPLLRAVEPAVRLVSERHLRKVLHYLIDREHPVPINLGQPYWVSREDLETGRLLPEHVLAGTEPRLLLATGPSDRMLDRIPLAVQLRSYWRVLFRAAVMRAIDRDIDSGILGEANCLKRLEHFGLAAAREIRAVLLAEHLLTSDADATLRYRAFAALYLDLASFEPEAVGHYFPSLPAGPAVSHLLADGLDAEHLLAAMRPSGAADAILEARSDESAEPPEAEQAPSDKPARLLQTAQEAEERGNHARAAILRAQCGMVTAGDDRARALSGADAALGQLVDALAGVFNWSEETRQEWRQDLAPLLTRAARGFWPRAARCLYELQKIPANLSREVFAVDLAESIRTFGRRPVKRPLPHARPVLILMSLKKAQSLMLRAGLRSAARSRLDRLFHEQIHSLAHAIRHEFTPIIAGALQTAGLVPVNAVEEVARDKLIAELLDRVCERGYLRIGDLRDAISRNRLKMDDLTGFSEFFRGDALLRADIAMAYALDGVYRKGEFYLRWIQRCISIFFGTSLGRLFTLYIAVPFGGAFMALMFMEELRHIGGKLAHLVSKPVVTAKAEPPPTAPTDSAAATPDVIDPDELDIDDDGQVVWVDLKPGTVTSDQVGVDDDGNPFLLGTAPGAALVTDVFTSSAPAAPHHEHPPASDLIAWPTILGLGVFLLLMFHVPPFQRAVFAFLRRLWWVVRGVLWDVPSAIWHSRTVRGVRQSLVVRFLEYHFWSPFLITLLVLAILLVLNVKPLLLLRPWTVYFWAILTLTYNTPWGWVVQDRIAETVSDGWRLVRVNLVPGLIGTIIDWFKMLANWVERQLYAVDEWFRFRGGDSAGSLALKAGLGLIWFPIAYLFRFVFYLLVEPQVNPVKHFPVVTVSHKVIWPMVPQIAEMTNISVVTVSMFVNGVPGIFGFIAWELKENWRLYRANRPGRLRPVMIGSHGETMRGLLRPGFHSGTIPKLFRKLRHASRPKAFWLHHDLDHTAEGVRRFTEREFIHLLDSSKEWGGMKLEVRAIHFGYQRLVIELTVPGLTGDPFVLALENVGGIVEAFVDQVGWGDKLTEPRRSHFIAALRGFLDMAAAERIDGHARLESGGPVGQGFADLASRMTWNEWMAKWDSMEDGTEKVHVGRGKNPPQRHS